MKFAEGLTRAEYAEAKRMEDAGLASISKIVRAFERGECEIIQAWRKAMSEKSSK